MSWPILSVLIWLPIAGAIVVLLLGSGARAQLGKQVALGTSILTFVLSIPLFTGFDASTAAMQFVENVPWIRALPGVLRARRRRHFDAADFAHDVPHADRRDRGLAGDQARPAQYFASFLLLEGMMIGVFAATDALLFYVFWEAMLVPMFIIIGVWGGERRVYATVKFFLYTFLGSVFMLVALIYMYLQGGQLLDRGVPDAAARR